MFRFVTKADSARLKVAAEVVLGNELPDHMTSLSSQQHENGSPDPRFNILPLDKMTNVVTRRPPLGCAAITLSLFRAALQKHQLPITNQREIVARTLFASGQLLSADEIIERLRDGGSHVGKATVYRTLGLLVQVGLASEHDFDEGFKRYETRIGPARHDHLICTLCGVVEEFQRDDLDRVQSEVAKQQGFRVLTRQFKLYGLCAQCDKRSGEALS